MILAELAVCQFALIMFAYKLQPTDNGDDLREKIGAYVFDEFDVLIRDFGMVEVGVIIKFYRFMLDEVYY